MKIVIDIPDNEVPTRQEYVEIGLHFIDGHIGQCTYPFEELEDRECCENCPFKKFSEDLTDKLAKVMADNGITDFDEFAKCCGVSYLHQDSITKSDTKLQ